MRKKQVLEERNTTLLSISFDGFFDSAEFWEARRTMKEEIGVEYSDFSSGWDSITGTTITGDIELKWTFTNWFCIELEYNNPKDDASVEKVRQWAKQIFANLIAKFGEESEA